MHQILWLLYIAIIWYKKSTSLPKLYFCNIFATQKVLRLKISDHVIACDLCLGPPQSKILAKSSFSLLVVLA